MDKNKSVNWIWHKPFWSFLILLLSWLFFFNVTIRSIFWPEIFTTITWASYGIFFAAIYLIYENRFRLANAILVSSQLGLLCLFLLAAGFVIGGVANLAMVMQAAVILMIPAMVMTVFGPDVTRILIFPLIYMLCIIPLQDSTLIYRTWILGGSGIAYFGYWLLLRRISAEAQKQEPTWMFQNARWSVPTLLTVVSFMVSPWLMENIRSFYPPQQREIFLVAPSGINGWRGPVALTNKNWLPRYLNASSTLQANYFQDTGSDTAVYLYSAYYDSDRTVQDIMDHKNGVVDSSIWAGITHPTVQKVLFPNRGSLLVLETIVNAGVTKRVIWYWYYVTGVDTIDASLASILDTVRLVSKYAQGSGVMIISTEYHNNPEEARVTLRTFLTAMIEPLQNLKRPEISYTPVVLTQSGK